MEVYLLGGPMDSRHHDVAVPYGQAQPSQVIVQVITTGRLASLCGARYARTGESTPEGVPVYRPG